VSSAPTPGPGIRRWKTVKKVELFRGNLVLDCPVPGKLLSQLPFKTEREYTHMRFVPRLSSPFPDLAERRKLTAPNPVKIFGSYLRSLRVY
jgi:chitin synthase